MKVRTAIAIALVMGVSVLRAGPAAAYEPTVDEIVTRFLETTPSISRAIIETHSVVFDPFAGTSKSAEGAAAPGEVLTPGVGEDEKPTVEQPEREFVQTTYWVRDSLQAVETFSPEGELLHFYLSEGLQPVSVSLVPERPFTDWDVVLPYLPFLEGKAESWREGIERWGVTPSRVDLVRSGKGGVHYRLVESPGKSVWVDRDRFLPLKIETLIDGGGEPLELTIEFVDFLLLGNDEEGPLLFPRAVNYLLNGRLFKQTRLRRFQEDPPWSKMPLQRLRAKGAELYQASLLTGHSGGEG